MFKKISPAFKISLIYFLFSITWILVSDKIIYLFTKNNELASFLQTLKGSFFILLTSLIIYYLVNRYFSKEKELRKRIEDIFDNASIPLVLFNEDGIPLMLNKVWSELTGYKIEEINTFEKWASNAFKDKANEVMKIFQSYYDCDKRVDVGEFQIHTKDNKILTWHFYMVPYGMIDNRRVYIASAIDITQLKENEKLLVQQSKMATMGEMIGNIAHQWKQPLSIIRGANSILKMDREIGGFEDRIDKSIEEIDNSVQNLATTIDDFRNFFSPKKESLNFEIKETFEKTFNLIKSQFVNNEIEIISNIENSSIKGFENELLQVLINIIKNAKEELVKVDGRRLLFIDSFKKDDNLVIRIKDNALGIPSEIKDKIFDKYFTTKEKDGTGIGLYMSRQIIEGMNGSITAYNEEYEFEGENYKGAVFEIRIPSI